MDRAVSSMAKELLGRDITESETSFTHKTVEKQIFDDIDRMLSGAGFTKTGAGQWASSDTEVSFHAEDHPQTGKRLIHKAQMMNDEGTTVGNISLPPIQIEVTQYLQILHSLKDFVGSRVVGKTESLDEGYAEYKKDPNFFKETRPGGKYVAKKEGVKYVIVSKQEADRIRNLPAGKPNKDGYLALYFVPKEYTKNAKGEVKRGMFAPIWDWGPGKKKGGFAEDLETFVDLLNLESAGYPSVGAITPMAGPPQTGSAGRYGNPQTGEKVGLPVSKQNSGEGESLYPVEVTTTPKVGTPPQSGSGRRYGNEAQKLREAVLGGSGSKVSSDMHYPSTSGIQAETPPPESASPGDAADVPCGCDFDDKTDRKGGGGKTKMEYPTVN